jgi:tryptophan synthase alpha subunit
MTVKATLQLTSAQLTGRLTHLAFGMNPTRLHRIEPGAFGQQAKNEQADISVAFSLLVVSSDPLTHLFALVPTGIISHDHHHTPALPTGDVQQSSDKDQGMLAVRLPIGEIQVDLVGVVANRPIAGQSFRLTPTGLALDQLGFGISTPGHVRSINNIVDGFIVGSALVKAAGENIRVIKNLAVSLRQVLDEQNTREHS